MAFLRHEGVTTFRQSRSRSRQPSGLLSRALDLAVKGFETSGDTHSNFGLSAALIELAPIAPMIAKAWRHMSFAAEPARQVGRDRIVHDLFAPQSRQARRNRSLLQKCYRSLQAGFNHAGLGHSGASDEVLSRRHVLHHRRNLQLPQRAAAVCCERWGPQCPRCRPDRAPRCARYDRPARHITLAETQDPSRQAVLRHCAEPQADGT